MTIGFLCDGRTYIIELFKLPEPQYERRLMPLFAGDIGLVLQTEKRSVCLPAEPLTLMGSQLPLPRAHANQNSDSGG